MVRCRPIWAAVARYGLASMATGFVRLRLSPNVYLPTGTMAGAVELCWIFGQAFW